MTACRSSSTACDVDPATLVCRHCNVKWPIEEAWQLLLVPKEQDILLEQLLDMQDEYQQKLEEAYEALRAAYYAPNNTLMPACCNVEHVREATCSECMWIHYPAVAAALGIGNK